MFDISKKGAPPQDVSQLCKMVATAANIDAEELQMQYDDIVERVIAESRTLSGADINRRAWRNTICKIKRFAFNHKSHPTNVLEEALSLYFCFGASSSGVEQAFSKADNLYGVRRLTAHEVTQDYTLRIILDLPSHDRAEIITLAQRIWCLVYGTSRTFHDSRISKGVKRKSVSDGLTNERDFISQRRSVVRQLDADENVKVRSLDSDSLMQEAASGKDMEGWTGEMSNELEFQKAKLVSRMIQAKAEGMMGTPCDDAAVTAAHLARVKEQRARDRKQMRDHGAIIGKSGREFITDVHGLKVFCCDDLDENTRDLLSHYFQKYDMKLSPLLSADIVLTNKVGQTSEAVSLVTALRGCYQSTPSLITSHGEKGCAMCWAKCAKVTRMMYISTGCFEHQQKGVTFLRQILDQIPSNKITIKIGDQDVLNELITRYKNKKSVLIAVVQKHELKTSVPS